MVFQDLGIKEIFSCSGHTIVDKLPTGIGQLHDGMLQVLIRRNTRLDMLKILSRARDNFD